MSVAAAMLVAVGPMSAWACTSLATLTPNPVTAEPGQRVTVTGQNFVPDAGPVSFRFSSQAAPVLTTATPNKAGDVSASFTTPKAQPGSYVLFATQVKDGKPVFGTPARSVVVVQGPAGNSLLQATPGQDVDRTGSATATARDTGGNETLSTALLVITGVAGLALFAAGLAAFAVSVHRRPQPEVQR